MPPVDFFISSYVAVRLGLKENYFKLAFQRGYELNAELILEQDKYLFVKLPTEVLNKLNDLYLCDKINKEDISDYDYVYKLSKNCLIGFWK